jgi:hypothetical protein
MNVTENFPMVTVPLSPLKILHGVSTMALKSKWASRKYDDFEDVLWFSINFRAKRSLWKLQLWMTAPLKNVLYLSWSQITDGYNAWMLIAVEDWKVTSVGNTIRQGCGLGLGCLVSDVSSWDGLETYQRFVSVSSRTKCRTSRSRLGLEAARLGLGY